MKRSFNHILHNMGRRCGLLSRSLFADHILILGGGRAALGIVRAVAHDEVLRSRQILVVTKRRPRELYDYIFSHLTREEQGQVNVAVMYGERCHDEALKAAKLSKASHIYIVGDDADADRDARNVACWHKVRDSFEMQVAEPSRFPWMRRNEDNREKAVVQCHLYLYDEVSVKLFHALQQESHKRVETTVVSYYEEAARQLLVNDTLTDQDCSLDRGLITFDNDRYVHLIVLGMTSMGCAIAATAAQLCHFPNFDETSARPIRTKITFVDAQADVLMNQYKARHASLSDLSHYTLRTSENDWQTGRPQAEYGDFLDVEWEFWKGSPADDWVRQLIVQYAADERQVLSVAVCGMEGQRNLDEALSLPNELYRVADDYETHQNIPMVYLYQPEEACLAKSAHDDILRYRNLVPFGTDEYSTLAARRRNGARQLNALLRKEKNQPLSDFVPSQLDVLWRLLSFDEKMSCCYFADALFTQLRGLASLLPQDGAEADERLLQRLSHMAQSRWNMERLFVGCRAMPAEERDRLNAALQSEDEKTRREAKIQSKRNCNHLFVLKDIAPYQTLSQERKDDFKVLYRNIMQADAKLVRTIQSASTIVNCRKEDEDAAFPGI